MQISGVNVTSWAVVPTPTPTPTPITTSNPNTTTPVDDFFTVHISYQNNYIPNFVGKTTTFKMDRRENLVWDAMFNVSDWLEKLDVHGDAHPCAIDVMTESFECLLDEASDDGCRRKSLAMVVNINMGKEFEYDDDDDDQDPMFSDDFDQLSPQEEDDDDDDEPEVEYEAVQEEDLMDDDDDDDDDDDLEEPEVEDEEEVRSQLRFRLEVSGVDFCNGYTENCCSICLDEFNKSHDVAKLTCSHIFHQDCLLSLTYKNQEATCPSCRSQLLMC